MKCFASNAHKQLDESDLGKLCVDQKEVRIDQDAEVTLYRKFKQTLSGIRLAWLQH